MPAADDVQRIRGEAQKHLPQMHHCTRCRADAVGLLDALGIDRAHVVGMSMGGMIGQQAAISFPERVASLVSVMSTTGNYWLK